jgi:hypothetical protein
MKSSLKSRLVWRNDQSPNFVVLDIVGMADGSYDDSGTEEGVDVKSPFFSNIVACSAAISSN